MSDTNPTGWKKTADDLFARVRELEAEKATLQAQLAEYRDIVTHWQAENERLRAELEVTDQLLNERNRVMAVIPECPEHGKQCVPYAIDWIDSIRTERAELRKANGNLAAELAAVRAELAECRQAAFENGRETERAAGWGELEY